MSVAYEDLHALPEFHPWATFEPGAWRLARTILEQSTQGKSNVANRTCMETFSQLREKNPLSASVTTETVVALAGKRVKIDPKSFTSDFFGVSVHNNPIYWREGCETLSVAGEPIPCQIIRIESSDKKSVRKTKIWFNPSRSPFIFKRETKICLNDNQTCCEETTIEVVSIDVQTVVLGKIYNGYQCVRTSKFETYRTTSRVIASKQIPGEIITRVTEEHDLSGALRQRSTVELLDFGFDANDRQKEMFCGSTVHSGRSFVPPRPLSPRFSAAGMERREFTIQFSQPEPGAESTESASVPQEGAAPNSDVDVLHAGMLPPDVYDDIAFFKRFRQRWKDSKEHSSVLATEAPQTPAQQLLGIFDLGGVSSSPLIPREPESRSPIYSRRSQRAFWEREVPQETISTNALRVSVSVEKLLPHEGKTKINRDSRDSRDSRENRGNWRRNWRALWNPR
ncbi:MAG: hypothetical protein Q4D38_05580 [Planctomycetia bacterium]|nr:hypothetical protein [Planctomycetia bacterium]